MAGGRYVQRAAADRRTPPTGGAKEPSSLGGSFAAAPVLRPVSPGSSVSRSANCNQKNRHTPHPPKKKIYIYKSFSQRCFILVLRRFASSCLLRCKLNPRCDPRFFLLPPRVSSHRTAALSALCSSLAMTRQGDGRALHADVSRQARCR